MTPFADKNLLDVIADGKIPILVAERRGAPSPGIEESGLSRGTVKAVILRELTQDLWTGPRDIELNFCQYESRQIRIREGSLGWNGVDLQATRFLLIALPDPGPRAVQPLDAVAVAPLRSADDDLVSSVQKILAIESTTDPVKRASMISEGLTGPLEFLADYCHYALGRLARIPRAKAVEMELNLMDDSRQQAQRRIMAEANLELELWKTKDADDFLNKKILAGLFDALPNSDSELRRLLVLAIYNKLCPVFPEGESAAEEYRKKLMAGVALPPKESLLRILGQMHSDRDLSAELSWLEAYLSAL